MLAADLSRSLIAGAHVRIEQWVSTPDGEQSVDLVLLRGDRRVGLVIGRRYEQNAETFDALRLVYGGFDVLYRVTGIGSRCSVADVLHAFACEKPAWFTEAGRIEVGRRAAEDVLLGLVDRDASLGYPFGANGISIRRMRLSRANEWGEAFERALGPAGHRLA